MVFLHAGRGGVTIDEESNRINCSEPMTSVNISGPKNVIAPKSFGLSSAVLEYILADLRFS
jgi:hypothetical protein